MKEFHAPPRQSAQPTPGRRFWFGSAGLLVLLIAGLALVAWTAMRDRAGDGTEDEVARVAKEYRSASVSGSLPDILVHPDLIPTHAHPLLGRPAPDFALPDSEGQVRGLGELRAGRPLVVIFYYGYSCDHCVRQLFDVNRDLPLFREVGARVVAISADPPELTRRRFEQYGPFGFPVLSDPGNKVAHAYQVFRADLLRHGTFVIDRAGTVQWVNVGDAPLRRDAALLSQLAKMEGRLSSVQPDP